MTDPHSEEGHQRDSSTWGASPARDCRLSLEKGEALVWFAMLDDLAPSLGSFSTTLTGDETQRAKRFKFQKDREQYVLGRGLLRKILSCYSGMEPGELRFRYGPHGKPYLIGERPEPNLMFNFSQTERAVICAVARDGEIGVDLEYVNEGIDDAALAEQYFSASEAAALAALPLKARQKAFLKCWTRKEAYIKATGAGLFLDLRGFEVFESVNGAPRLHIAKNPQESERWTLVDLEVPAGYVAALAMECRGCRVRCHHWPGDIETRSR
jgi:4'-phosphopantetheinyl transferase